MTKPKEHSPYKAALRRKKIAQAKFQKHREYEAEMAEIAERIDRQRGQHTSISS